MSMPRLRSFLAAAFSLLATLARADAGAETQLLRLGTFAGPAPESIPAHEMAVPPEADRAAADVFAALLRARHVSVLAPEGGAARPDQLVAELSVELAKGADGPNLRFGDLNLTIAEFRSRFAALVEGFGAASRPVLLVHLVDPEAEFPASLNEVTDALASGGFNLLAVMVEEKVGDTADCASLPGPLESVVAGVADREPFGNGDGVTSGSEAERFLARMLSRMAERGGACGPSYSLILNNAKGDTPLLTHEQMTASASVEETLYAETFEARFLMTTQEAAGIEAFAASCMFCPFEDQLQDKLDEMRERERAEALERSIWERMGGEGSAERLAVYLDSCTLCIFREEAGMRLAALKAKEEAALAERDARASAIAAKDLVALRRWLDECEACEERASVESLLAELEENAAYRRERDAADAALAAQDRDALAAYLAGCETCDAKEQVEKALAEMDRREEARAACVNLAGVPQLGGPRRLEDINRDEARAACNQMLETFPDDWLAKTLLARVDQASGNRAAALEVYTEAAEAGIAPASGLSAYLAYAPETGEPDIAAAEALALKGAEKGDWLSRELLTIIYSRSGVPGKGPEDAAKLAMAMAEEGNALGQFFMGFFHLSGSGAPQSDQKAAEYFGQAVEKGYVPAYPFLAELLEQGRGADQNTARASELYWTALEERDTTARRLLTESLVSRHPDVVRAMQQKLSERGFYLGRVDGLVGPGTIGAVERFLAAEVARK